MSGWRLTSRQVNIGELSLRGNWDLFSTRIFHLYPCLIPTLKTIYVSIFMMMRLTLLLLYINLIADDILGGAPYFPSMAMSSAWLEVSKDLDRYFNGTHFGR